LSHLFTIQVILVRIRSVQNENKPVFVREIIVLQRGLGKIKYTSEYSLHIKST
jgi:hypothetical protein